MMLNCLRDNLGQANTDTFGGKQYYYYYYYYYYYSLKINFSKTNTQLEDSYLSNSLFSLYVNIQIFTYKISFITYEFRN